MCILESVSAVRQGSQVYKQQLTLIGVFFNVFSVSQIKILSSVPADAIRFPFAEKESEVIRPVWKVHLDETRVVFCFTSTRMMRPVA